MKIKLVIDGGDERLRIIPVSESDKKLLEYIAEWDGAKVNVNRESDSYSYSQRKIKSIDLVFEMHPHEDGTMSSAEIPSV